MKEGVRKGARGRGEAKGARKVISNSHKWPVTQTLATSYLFKRK